MSPYNKPRLSRGWLLPLVLAVLLNGKTAGAAGAILYSYPLGFGNIDTGGHRPIVVQTDSYKFVYDLGRPSMTELYNLAKTPSGGSNLLDTASGPGGYIGLTDGFGKSYLSYLSDGNTRVTVTKGSSTFQNVYRTRTSVRQAGRVFYRIDVVGIKLQASDGTLAPMTIRQRFNIWPDKLYVETQFSIEADININFAEVVARYLPSRFTHISTQLGGALPLAAGLLKYFAPSDPYVGLFDSTGANGGVGHVVVNRTNTDSFLFHDGPYWGSAGTLNVIQRACDYDMHGQSTLWRAGQTVTLYSQMSFSGRADQADLNTDATNEANPINITRINSSSGCISGITYQNTFGAYRLEIPADYPVATTPGIDYADAFQNHYETARLKLTNGATARPVRLFVTRGTQIAGSSPWGELVVADGAGFPTGILTEQNSQWEAHEIDDFFACYASIPMNPSESREIELKLALQNWGRKPIIRMQCQDLNYWEGTAESQQWMQASIGQGESMVYYVQRVTCTVNDVRPLDGRRLAETTAWRDNCGGWEFLKFASGLRPESKGLVYRRSGPNLFDFNLTGAMDDGSITSDIRVIGIPANEVTRTFFHIRYDVKSTISIASIAANLRLFSLGDENYSAISYPSVAYTDTTGAVVNQSALSSFTNRRIGGSTPWACTYGANPSVGTGGNRGFVLRSYTARVNGSTNNNAAITLTAGGQTRLNLTTYSSATRLIAGDYFEFDLETVAFGDPTSNYSRMQTEAASFGALKPSVLSTQYGTKVSDFPAHVDIGPNGYADFTIIGGRDIIPIEVGGFDGSTNATASDLRVEELIGSVWVPLDDSVSGRDWLQTEKDVAGTFSYILALYTDGSSRRLRFSRTLNKTEVELFASTSLGLVSCNAPVQVGGAYLAGLGNSPIMTGDWALTSVTNTNALARKFTPFVRYAAVTAAALRLEVNGVDQTGIVVLPSTGGAGDWRTLPLPPVTLNSGVNSVKIISDKGGTYLDWIEYRYERPTSVVADDAIALWDDVPFNLSSNIPTVCSITLLNTGSTTWTVIGGYGLWCADELGAAVLHPVTSNVLPGQSYTFRFTTAPPPAAVRLYQPRWQMKNASGVFGASVTRAMRSTDLVISYSSARFVSDTIPLRMSASEKRTVQVTVRNTGTTTWLGTGDSDSVVLARADGFGVSDSALPAGISVAPGEEYTFALQITSRYTPGVYMLRMRMKKITSGSFGPYENQEIEVKADASPPSPPIVTSASYQPASGPLAASWVAADPESGIVASQYSVGPLAQYNPGSLVVGWTDVGTAKSASVVGTPFVEGAHYFFYVRVRNGAGMWSLPGVSNAITAMRRVARIADVKALDPGTKFTLPEMLVGSASDGVVFIEQPDRATGLRLNWSGPYPDLHTKLVVSGEWLGYVDNEPTATGLLLTPGAPGTAEPMIMSGSQIGWEGGGLPKHMGSDTRCLLVRLCGTIRAVLVDGVVVDDGSDVSDWVGVTDALGIRASLPVGLPLRVGQMVDITGISRGTSDGKRWVMTRSSADIAIRN